MGSWQEIPEWAQELAEHFQEGESALFILHGQVFDYTRVNGDYLPFRHFLGHWLAQSRQVVFYNLGLGLEFWDAAGENLDCPVAIRRPLAPRHSPAGAGNAPHGNRRYSSPARGIAAAVLGHRGIAGTSTMGTVPRRRQQWAHADRCLVSGR